MKTKTNTPKKRDQRDRIDSKKSNITKISTPSAERHPGVETEPTPSQSDIRTSADVTPQKGTIDGEVLPSMASRVAHFESQEFSPDSEAELAKFYKEIERNWNLRLDTDFHFEELEGFCGVDYHLLFYRGRNILVSADDVARSTTCGAGSESQIGYSAAEIIGTLDARDVVEVPGPEIPKNLAGAVEGTYIPIELAVAILAQTENRARRELREDVTRFSTLLTDFEDKKEHLREVRLRQNRLRKARLIEAYNKIYSLWLGMVEERKAKLRSEKRKS